VYRHPWPARHRARAAAVTTAAALLSLLVAPVGAVAAPNRGVGSGAETVSSGTWGASASPATPTWTTGQGGRKLSTETNTGTLALSALTYKVTISSGSGTTTFTLAACPVAWDGGGNCPGGGSTTIGGTYTIGSTTTVSSTDVPNVGGALYLKATASNNVTSAITMTLQLSVTSPSQLRAPVVTNQ